MTIAVDLGLKARKQASRIKNSGDPDQPADTDLHCFQNRINTVHVFSSCIYDTRRVGTCVDPYHRGHQSAGFPETDLYLHCFQNRKYSG